MEYNFLLMNARIIVEDPYSFYSTSASCLEGKIFSHKLATFGVGQTCGRVRGKGPFMLE